MGVLTGDERRLVRAAFSNRVETQMVSPSVTLRVEQGCITDSWDALSGGSEDSAWRALRDLTQFLDAVLPKHSSRK